ncbi:MAG: SRPBCC family protein [Actinomycetota bacterium]|nr:SRPBCC family protein [Actinomycetota bacterium]MDQ5808188.1 SRPBCC family protein [Actinomycetota bacterium]
MALNEIHIDAPPERVFAVLADWRSYGDWVVGSRKMRGVDPGFPAAGTRFHHQVGWGPLTLNDHTTVLEVDQPRKLILKAKARPLGTAVVDLEMRAENGGTRVVMREDPGDTATAFVFNPLTHLLVRGRNTESLQRLKRLAEERPDIGREVDVPPGKVEP